MLICSPPLFNMVVKNNLAIQIYPYKIFNILIWWVRFFVITVYWHIKIMYSVITVLTWDFDTPMFIVLLVFYACCWESMESYWKENITNQSQDNHVRVSKHSTLYVWGHGPMLPQQGPMAFPNPTWLSVYYSILGMASLHFAQYEIAY